MEIISSYEEKVLKYFLKKDREISKVLKKFGNETFIIIDVLQELSYINGKYKYGNNYYDGDLSDKTAIGTWSITAEGRLYFKQHNADANKRIKDLILENLIAFGFGLISGLVTGIAVGYILPK